MKIAYFDCFSGASGDMILGALVDLGVSLDYLKKELGKLKLDGYTIKKHTVIKNGIKATKIDVITRKKEDGKNLDGIYKIIDNSNLSNKVKISAKKIFYNLANAEAKVHNKNIKKIHFHEVGALDAIIDVVGSVIGIHKLGIEKIYCSPFNIGSGFIKSQHGTYPAPGFATAELLKNVEIYSKHADRELVTPTGAAILTALCDNFEMPKFRLDKIGHGAGTYDLKIPNVLRVMVGNKDDYGRDEVTIIETNIDDMNPQIYDYVMEKLFDEGALEVYLINIMMKKNRPGVLLVSLCKHENKDKLLDVIFNETPTLGVRIHTAERRILERESVYVKTKFGRIRVKVGKNGNNIKSINPEYEDCKKAAKKNKVPIKDIYEESMKIAGLEFKNKNN